MTKIKTDNAPDKELQVKQLQTSLENEKKNSGKNARRKLFKTNINKYNQSETTHNSPKI